MSLTLKGLEITGVAFDLIIIRISRGISTEQTQAFSETFQLPMNHLNLTSDTLPHGKHGPDPVDIVPSGITTGLQPGAEGKELENACGM